jgi:bifunctional DNase/RNase
MNWKRVLYQYLTYNDLEEIVNPVPTSHDINEILPIFKSLKGKLGALIIHSLNDQIEIREKKS